MDGSKEKWIWEDDHERWQFHLSRQVSCLRCISPNVKILTCTLVIFGRVSATRLVFSDFRMLSILTIFASSQMLQTYWAMDRMMVPITLLRI